MSKQEIDNRTTNFKIAHGVYMGTLMSPTEVARATAGRDSPVYGALHRWTLCGDVSPTVFELVQAVQMGSSRTNERVTAFSSPAGHGYVVFTHQIGSFQHRYLVPLYDSRVKECLEHITRDGVLGYSLAGENNQAIVWRTVLGPRDFVPLKPMCGTVADGQEEAALEEYSRLLGEARDPARIPSVLEGVFVRYASVSAIPPNDLVTRLARRYGVEV
jgi:hypothetical protein